MPAGKNTKNSLKTGPFSLALLLLQILLITIGQAPIVIIKLIVESLWWAVGYLSKIRFPHFEFLTLNFKLPRPGQGRGRPRKSWFLPYYLTKLRLFFKKKVSKKTKIGLALLTLIILLFIYTQFILSAAYQLPSPDKLVSPQTPLTTEFYDRSGKLLYRLYEGRNRSLAKLDELPPYLTAATIAAEDKNFYKHAGVDLEAIFRAFLHNIQNKNHNEGASTITQQLVKNTLLTPEKTYTRKIKEIILSLWAENIYSKADILQMYFNEAPYGGPNWGIKAASLAYFGKEPKDLNLSEAAFLAGLPASPSQFSPYGTNPELGIDRQKQVLQRMVEEGYISANQAAEAVNTPLKLEPPETGILAPHFVFYIKDILAKKYGQRVVSQGGLKILTSLDLDLQKEVEKIVSVEVTNLENLNVKNGAAMVLDGKSGQILAMVGSRDYFHPKFGNFNTTLALRQPGSSIKPITYTVVFKKGYSPGNTVLDTPVSFKDDWGNSYTPVNYDGKFRGPVSIRVALGSSFNIPAVKLLASIGLADMIQTAKDLGISSFEDKSRFGLSLTLGGGEVKMIEMMGVYQTFSQMGQQSRPTGILKVTNSAGNVLEEYQDHKAQVLSPEIAYLITHILADNGARTPAFGPNSLLNLPGTAVKTGTSDNKRDNWTFGYTPEYVVGVWVGNNDNSPMNPQLASGVTGAAPIWNKIMKSILSVHPSLGFDPPPGIAEAVIDGRKDLAIAGNIPKSLVRVRKDADKTIFSDTFSSFATASAQAAVKNGTTN